MITLSDYRIEQITKETNCMNCIHRKVCSFDKTRFCVNYQFKNNSNGKVSCGTCICSFRRYATYEEDYLPCFKCKYFDEVL